VRRGSARSALCLIEQLQMGVTKVRAGTRKKKHVCPYQSVSTSSETTSQVWRVSLFCGPTMHFARYRASAGTQLGACRTMRASVHPSPFCQTYETRNPPSRVEVMQQSTYQDLGTASDQCENAGNIFVGLSLQWTVDSGAYKDAQGCPT
jgi:hypothetical protein